MVVRRIARCAVIIAFNVISGYLLKFLPNVKPSTVSIICFAVYFSLGEALFISVGSALLQACCFGFGTFIPFQIFAWCIIAIFSYILRKYLYNKVAFVAFSAIAGFIFGFIISFDMLIVLGPVGFIVYYLNGLIFDIFHVIGNIMFSFVFFDVVVRLKNIKENKLKENY